MVSAVNAANADLLTDIKTAIAGAQAATAAAVHDVGTEVSGIATAVTADVQTIIGTETNAVENITNSVVAGIKGILPFPL